MTASEDIRPAHTVLLSIEEVRARLGGLSRWSVYRLMDSNQLEFVRPNRRRLVPEDALEHYIETLRGEDRV